VPFEDQLRSALDSALAGIRPRLEDELRPCIQDVARAAAEASGEAAVAELASAIRALDAARSLAETLDVLARVAGTVMPGATLFIVTGAGHRLWRGIDLEGPPPSAEAIETGIPVRVGGSAVAFVYAREPNPALDILASHAGRLVEALTMQQAVGL